MTALVRLDEPDRMRGLVVMVQDDEEVVLVNVIGALKPETFAFAMDELGIDLPTTVVALPGDCALVPQTQAGVTASVAGDGIASVRREPDAHASLLPSASAECREARL